MALLLLACGSTPGANSQPATSDGADAPSEVASASAAASAAPGISVVYGGRQEPTGPSDTSGYGYRLRVVGADIPRIPGAPEDAIPPGFLFLSDRSLGFARRDQVIIVFVPLQSKAVAYTVTLRFPEGRSVATVIHHAAEVSQARVEVAGPAAARATATPTATSPRSTTVPGTRTPTSVPRATGTPAASAVDPATPRHRLSVSAHQESVKTNGARDPGEPAVPTLDLTVASARGGAAIPLRNNGDGTYSAESLPAGDYQLRIANASGLPFNAVALFAVSPPRLQLTTTPLPITISADTSYTIALMGAR